MHTRLTATNLAKNLTYLSSTVFAGLILSACTTKPIVVPVEERAVTSAHQVPATPPAEDDEITSTPVEDRRYQIEQAERYAQIAENKSNDQAIDAALSAAEYYIQGSDAERAEQSVLALDPSAINRTQNNRYQIIRAWAEYSRGDPARALIRTRELLEDPENQGEESRPQRVDAYLLASLCHQELQQLEPALVALIDREALLLGEARAETSRYIWQVIDQIPITSRQQIIDQATNPRVRIRLEQSFIGQVGQHIEAPQEFDRWRQQSNQTLPSQVAQPGRWSGNSPRSIVVLLPLSSRYQRAAQAVKEGFEQQHSLNDSASLPSLQIVDIGGDPMQAAAYYNAAWQSGADMIVGPLGKDFADALLHAKSGNLEVPTILLGGKHSLPQGTLRLDLNPEHESHRIAEYATQRGYVNALILAPSSNKGQRLSNAFSRRWLELGGKISKQVQYSPEQFDHSTELRLMFDVNQSQARFHTLSNMLGYQPKFSPYKRNDIDFIYLIADHGGGRIIRPQVNFFGGQSLPVVANSDIYNGIEDIAKNMDLNNTQFPVMPWELASQNQSPYAGLLNKLFALGSDAYLLAGEHNRLYRQNTIKLLGNTGILSNTYSGDIHIEPIWATFRGGKAEPINERDVEFFNRKADLGPLLNRSSGRTKSYNESNWDKRESRGKTGL